MIAESLKRRRLSLIAEKEHSHIAETRLFIPGSGNHSGVKVRARMPAEKEGPFRYSIRGQHNYSVPRI